ncbi:MAG: VOC family protein [Alphaproteobacteria bacterium]|jgi:predicted enzyme related to lactoylglutathione lyase
MAKGKLRHLAISVPDPEKSAEFYMSTFGMEKVTSVKAPMADGVYLTDGTINLALLRYKDDRPMGEGKTKDWFGVHHFGFWVDDVDDSVKAIKDNGGDWFMGEMEGDNVFYEMKYTDPDGTIFDITHTGWGGARKDGPHPADDK